MRISKKAQYAIRALAIMASRSTDGPMQIQELADAGQIPSKFLEQILLVLKRSGFLRSKRGLGGGYQLDRPADAISLAEVIEIMDGALGNAQPPAGNGQSAGSKGLEECLDELENLTRTYLRSETIATILQREEPGSHIAFEI